MTFITGSKPWLKQYLLSSLAHPPNPPSLNASYLQAITPVSADRNVTLFDGRHTISAILSHAAASAVDADEDDTGITTRTMLGYVLAPVSAVVLPDIRTSPPTAKLILNEVRIFSDRRHQRPLGPLTSADTDPDVINALRANVGRKLASFATATVMQRADRENIHERPPPIPEADVFLEQLLDGSELPEPNLLVAEESFASDIQNLQRGAVVGGGRAMSTEAQLDSLDVISAEPTPTPPAEQNPDAQPTSNAENADDPSPLDAADQPADTVMAALEDSDHSAEEPHAEETLPQTQHFAIEDEDEDDSDGGSEDAHPSPHGTGDPEKGQSSAGADAGAGGTDEPASAEPSHPAKSGKNGRSNPGLVNLSDADDANEGHETGTSQELTKDKGTSGPILNPDASTDVQPVQSKPLGLPGSNNGSSDVVQLNDTKDPPQQKGDDRSKSGVGTRIESASPTTKSNVAAPASVSTRSQLRKRATDKIPLPGGKDGAEQSVRETKDIEEENRATRKSPRRHPKPSQDSASHVNSQREGDKNDGVKSAQETGAPGNAKRRTLRPRTQPSNISPTKAPGGSSKPVSPRSPISRSPRGSTKSVTPRSPVTRSKSKQVEGSKKVELDSSKPKRTRRREVTQDKEDAPSHASRLDDSMEQDNGDPGPQDTSKGAINATEAEISIERESEEVRHTDLTVPAEGSSREEEVQNKEGDLSTPGEIEKRGTKRKASSANDNESEPEHAAKKATDNESKERDPQFFLDKVNAEIRELERFREKRDKNPDLFNMAPDVFLPSERKGEEGTDPPEAFPPPLIERMIDVPESAPL